MDHRSAIALAVVATVAAEWFAYADQTATTTQGTDSAWAVPRTAAGHPDLQGTWTASEWALVPVWNFKGPRSTNRTGDVPTYWYEGWNARPDRKWMLIDPADGVIPLRPEAAKKARPDEWVDDTALDNIQRASELDQWSRCITRGPIPLVPTSYNAGIEIVQTRDHVAVFTEMIHEARIIPLDGRPHPPGDVRLWLGDARGRWEGDTLVVDITNFAEPDGRMLPSVFKTTGIYTGPGHKLHVTERFRRVSADRIDYEVTVEDPDTFTRPFTLGFPLKKDPEYEMYEYACHEANHFIPNVLNAARVKEKAAARARASQK
jgi:hypothetical protein